MPTSSRRLAREAGDSGLLARIAVATSGPWASGTELKALALLDEALNALDDHNVRQRVEVLNSLATALYFVDPEREARAVAQAEELAEGLGDPGALAQARLAVHRSLTHRPEARRERLDLSRSTFALTEVDVDPLLRLRIGRALLTDLLENTDVDGFDRGLDCYERDASTVKSPRDLYWAMVLRATQATLRGDLSLGEQLARGAQLRGTELDQTAAGAYILQQFAIRYQQGRLAEMVAPLRDSEERSVAYRGGLALTALVCVETGHHDDGLRIARSVVGADAPELRGDVFWLAFMCMFAAVAAATGDRDLAASLSETLAPCADHTVVFGAGGAVWGSGHSWLGQLAVAEENLDRAGEHFREAARIADRIGAPYWGAQARNRPGGDRRPKGIVARFAGAGPGSGPGSHRDRDRRRLRTPAATGRAGRSPGRTSQLTAALPARRRPWSVGDRRGGRPSELGAVGASAGGSAGRPSVGLAVSLVALGSHGRARCEAR